MDVTQQKARSVFVIFNLIRQLCRNAIMRTSKVGTTPMMETDGALIGS